MLLNKNCIFFCNFVKFIASMQTIHTIIKREQFNNVIYDINKKVKC